MTFASILEGSNVVGDVAGCVYHPTDGLLVFLDGPRSGPGSKQQRLICVYIVLDRQTCNECAPCECPGAREG
jgi:hypothetical protein